MILAPIKFIALGILPLVIGTKCFAGEWSQIDSQTIGFTGHLETGELKKFSAIFNPSIRELIVTNSGGGLTGEGIEIGNILADHDIKVTVVGYCMSSCANYIFLAGHKREIRNGIVGYHGNVQACFLGAKEQETRENVRKQLQEQGSKGVGLDTAIEDFMADTRKEALQEAALLSKMGVLQELFDRACDESKGYDFLLPTRDTFLKYGIATEGDQDRDVAATQSARSHATFRIE